jgi:hypothetical protein
MSGNPRVCSKSDDLARAMLAVLSAAHGRLQARMEAAEAVIFAYDDFGHAGGGRDRKKAREQIDKARDAWGKARAAHHIPTDMRSMSEEEAELVICSARSTGENVAINDIPPNPYPIDDVRHHLWAYYFHATLIERMVCG